MAAVDISAAEPRAVQIPPLGLEGLLGASLKAEAIVLFAHGSGSGHLSPRNTYVAEALRQAGLATLLFDLLTEEEARDRGNVFDIELLADRLQKAVEWVRNANETKNLSIGLFGSSTGAAAALLAAVQSKGVVEAVVSRGGRPDLAGSALAKVSAPTLFIVGGNDWQVLELNKAAFAQLNCEKQIAVVPGATHLFEEPGTLDQVIELAKLWFCRHLAPRAAA